MSISVKHSAHNATAFSFLLGLLIVFSAPAPSDSNNEETVATTPKLRLAATIPPLAMILQEIGGERVDVVTLLPPGQSPHTFSPRPSLIKAAANCDALFHVGESFDGWATDLPIKNQVAVLEMLHQEGVNHQSAFPQHDGGSSDVDTPTATTENANTKNLRPLTSHQHGPHCAHGAGEGNPHFWLDPISTMAVTPTLTAWLIEHDPGGAKYLEQRSEEFQADLQSYCDKMSSRISFGMEEAKSNSGGRAPSVFLFHGAFSPMLERFDVEVAGILEPSPGKTPTPRKIRELLRVAKEKNVRAIFTEPQLPSRPAEVLAESTGLPLFELDPLGGTRELDTYKKLLIHNAEVIRKALIQD